MATKAILLVDDEAILLLALKQSLRLHFGPEYRYETALSGAEGLERIDKLASEGVEVALVISDWLMPRMMGDAFLAAVHRNHPSIRLVMLSGHADDADMAKLAGEVELAAFLRKPWDPERLFAVVAGALA